MATENTYYVLLGEAKPLSKKIPSKHKRSSPLLYNDNGVQKEMRYCRNQESIFIKDQNEHAILDSIVFEDGSLSVDPDNNVLVNFLDKHPMNVVNGGNTFKKKDIHAEDKEALSKKEFIIKVQGLVMKAGEDILSVIAKKIGKHDTTRMTPEGIKRSALGSAEVNPSAVEEILKTHKGPDITEGQGNEASELATFAIAREFVSLRNNNAELFFNLPDKKTKISNIPAESTPTETLVDWFRKPQGQEFYKFLQKEQDKG